MHITERKLAEDNFRILADLNDISPVSITVQDLQGNFLYANQKTVDLHGYSKDEFLACNLHDIDVPASAHLIEARIQKIMEVGEAQFDVEHYRKDGTSFPLEVFAKKTKWGRKNVLLSIASDITERKQAEAKLKQQSDAMEASMDGIAILDEDHNYVYVNEAHAGIYGYNTSEELIGTSWRALYQEDELQRFDYNIMPELIQKAQWQGEATGKKKDGSAFSQEISLTALDNGGLICIVRDTTSRKAAEEALRKNEDKLKSIFRAAPVGIGVVSERVIVEANDRLCTMTGYKREELVGKSARMFYPDEKEFNFVGREKYRQIAARGTGTVETRWQCKDGRIIDVLLSSTPINPMDMTDGVTFTALDITVRKQVEEALQESEILQRTLLEKLPAGVIIIDPMTRIIENVNNAAAAMFGTQAERIVGHRCHTFLCPAEEGACPVYDRGQEVDNAEREMICADGSRRPVLKSVKRIQIGGQEKLLECFVDITEQKKAGAALRESEERYRIAIEASHDGIAIVQNDIHVYVNQSFLNMFRYNTLNEIIGRNNYCVIHPDDYERVVGYIQVRQKGEYAPTRYEFRGIRRDGAPIEVEVSVNTISYKGEKAILAYLRDITERKLAEAAVRESEAKYRSIFRNAVMGIFRTTPGGRYLSINPAGAKMYGYESEEEMMQSITDMAYQIYVHPEDRKRLHELLKSTDSLKPSNHRITPKTEV